MNLMENSPDELVVENSAYLIHKPYGISISQFSFCSIHELLCWGSALPSSTSIFIILYSGVIIYSVTRKSIIVAGGNTAGHTSMYGKPAVHQRQNIPLFSANPTKGIITHYKVRRNRRALRAGCRSRIS